MILRPVLYGMAILWLLCAAFMGGAMLAGRLLRYQPPVVFLTFKSGTEFTVSWADTRLSIVYERRLKNAVLPPTMDDSCRLLFPLMVDNQLHLGYLNLMTNQLRAYLPGYSSLSHAAWLPDKRRIWVRLSGVQRGSRYLILDTETGAEVTLAVPAFATVTTVETLWSPDARHGLMTFYDNGVPLFMGIASTATGDLRPLPAAKVTTAWTAWSPDGNWLALYEGGQPDVVILDTSGNIQHEQKVGDVVETILPVWLTSDRLLIIARPLPSEQIYTGYVWSLTKNTLTETPLRLPVSQFGDSGFGGASPDKQRFFYTVDGMTYIFNIASGELLTRTPSLADRAVWSPDGRYLVEHERRMGFGQHQGLSSSPTQPAAP